MHMNPKKYCTMMSDITNKEYTLLLQSGIGANLVNSKISAQYAQTFQQEFQGKFIPIIEAFKFKNSKIQAIDFLSLKRQIDLLTASNKHPSLSLFSLRYFLNEKLFDAYLSKYSQSKT